MDSVTRHFLHQDADLGSFGENGGAVFVHAEPHSAIGLIGEITEPVRDAQRNTEADYIDLFDWFRFGHEITDINSLIVK